MARPRWGQGYATEVVSAVVDAVFATTDFERVYARADVRNAASRRHGAGRQDTKPGSGAGRGVGFGDN